MCYHILFCQSFSLVVCLFVVVVVWFYENGAIQSAFDCSVQLELETT